MGWVARAGSALIIDLRALPNPGSHEEAAPQKQGLRGGSIPDIAALFVDNEFVVRDETPFEQILFAAFGRDIVVIYGSIFPETQNRIPSPLVCDRSHSGMLPASIKLCFLEIGEGRS
jgi:hypothetical protein